MDWKFIRVVGTETALLELILMAHNYAAQAKLDLRSRVYPTGTIRIFERTEAGAHLVFEARPVGNAWIVTSDLELPPEKHYPLPPQQAWAAEK